MFLGGYGGGEGDRLMLPLRIGLLRGDIRLTGDVGRLEKTGDFRPRGDTLWRSSRPLG